jgi:hypothetical protein
MGGRIGRRGMRRWDIKIVISVWNEVYLLFLIGVISGPSRQGRLVPFPNMFGLHRVRG